MPKEVVPDKEQPPFFDFKYHLSGSKEISSASSDYVALVALLFYPKEP